MIKIVVKNKITIEGLSQEHIVFLQKTLTLTNPMFHKMLAMGKSIWGVKKEFKYYHLTSGNIEIPRGMLTRIKEWCNKIGLEYIIDDQTINKKRDWRSMVSSVVLRDYQLPIVEKVLKHSEGIIWIGTGGGKTVLALEAICRLKKTATILVHNNVLLTQFINTCEQFYGYRPGVVNGEEKTVKDVTVATFQSLSSNPDLLKQLAEQTSILVVDECQSAITENRLKVIETFTPSHLYGLTATPERSESDGRTKAISFIFGSPIAQYEGTQCIPTVKRIYTGVEIKMDEYHRMVEEMVKNEQRNTLIRGLITGETLSGRKVLVLTKRIEHYQILRSDIPLFQTDLYKFISSDDKDRNDLLSRLRDGDEEFNCIFGTTSLLAVGTDIPRLDTVIIACDMKENVLTTQSVGRILRSFEGKPQPKIIDIVDNKNAVFWRQAKLREKLYQSKGWVIN